MTQNVTFENWEAEQMRDPEFRAAVEKLETEYQNERRRMKQTHHCCSDARLYLRPPHRAFNNTTSMGRQILSTTLNEWHMTVKDQLILVRYCPWCGIQLPRPAVGASSTNQ